MINRNADDSKKNYQQKIGNDFGLIFYNAFSEWVNLKIVWDQYESLFGSGKERVNLLNSAGASFFHSVEWSFFEMTVMAICRLTDPVVTKMGKNKKENLTVNQFASFMDTSERKNKMSTLLKELDNSVEFQRDWRNRRIGHNDLKLKLGNAAKLKYATREKMNKSIQDLHEVFSYIGIEFMSTNIADSVISSLNNEENMLQALYLGVEVRERELAAFRSGKTEKRLEYPSWLIFKQN